MAVQNSETGQPLLYVSDQSERGLLLRFARGRKRFFLMRSSATIAGSLLLGVLLAPWIGLATLFIALFGEMVDVFALSRVPRWLTSGMSMRRVSLIVSVTGGFQAATISICILMAGQMGDSMSSLFFAMAFLSGAAMNAGMYLSFHAASTQVRLAVYMAVFLILLALEIIRSQDHVALIFSVAAALIMLWMNYVLVMFMLNANTEFRRIQADLVSRGEALIKSNQDLREAQRETRNLALVAQNARDSIIMAQPDGRIIWVNAAFTDIRGYTPEDVLGKTPSEFLNGPETDEDGIRRIEEARNKGEEIRLEIHNYRKDGSQIWVDTTIIPIKDENGDIELVVGMERDISASKAHAKELERARDAAEAGAKAKATFLATMSHEIRTPMNAILGMAELLTEAELPPKQVAQAVVIEESASALLVILNDILDLSKLDADKIELESEDFDPGRVIQMIVELLQWEADSKELTVVVEVQNPLPQMVCGDKGRLRQIVMNVLGNAIKFTADGHVILRVSCTPDGRRHRLTIEVEDTGIGIAPEQIENVFDQFSQAEATMSRRFGGTGLGLPIARRLAELMGGGITVRSKLGEGSVFTLTVVMDPASGQVSAPNSIPRSAPIPSMRVLIAEDNATNRFLMTRFADGTECDVRFACNGYEAVAEAEAFRPDLIFMDVSMPGLDGLEATERIRELGAGCGSVPILALTANAMESDRRKCLAAGMDGFLAKPIRKQKFLDCLREWGRRNENRLPSG